MEKVTDACRSLLRFNFSDYDGSGLGLMVKDYERSLILVSQAAFYD